jgi:ribonucleoside-diphosphate reductase alpha chain
MKEGGKKRNGQLTLDGIMSGHPPVSPKEPERIRLPDERKAITHKFTFLSVDEDYLPTGKSDEEGRLLYIRKTMDLSGYVTLGFYPDGSPGELFLTIGKAGGKWRVYDALMVVISIGLQYGIPVQVFIRKLQHMIFEPCGVTLNSDIPLAKSVVDYLARWLKARYPLSEEESESGDKDEGKGSQGEYKGEDQPQAK